MIIKNPLTVIKGSGANVQLLTSNNDRLIDSNSELLKVLNTSSTEYVSRYSGIELQNFITEVLANV